ncbi:MAG TPA: FHA domain-containing protein [Lacipirellulaceae bacterium]
MFPTWRLKVREAQAAADSGRYDEAVALLEKESLRDFLPGKRLAQQVAGKIVKRAEEKLARGESAAAWRDLATADLLGGQAEAIGQLRQKYAERALGEARRNLAAGQTQAALAELDQLQRRGMFGETARLYRQIAKLMQDVEREAAHGHFAQATATLARAGDLIGKRPTEEGTMELARQLETRREQIAGRESDGKRREAELHAALNRQDWGAVLSTAEAVLAIAPQHEAARQARRQAWKAVGMDVTHAAGGRRPVGPVSLKLDRVANVGAGRSTRELARSGEEDAVLGNEHPQNGLLWVDAVGGFLVCLDDEIVLGQPSSGQSIAVPILADLSRRHAVIRREAGAYVLEPVQKVSVDGRDVNGPVVLADGQMIQLGDAVRIRFTKPHALSATARLDFASHHKTQPSADAVLLMADSCVMGPSQHCHVRCRDWQQDVVLYWQGDQLQCRSTAALAVDGQPRSGAIDVRPGERVEGESFSFTWESAG